MLNFWQRLFGADPADDDSLDAAAEQNEGTTVFVVDDEGRISQSCDGEVHDISASSDFAGEGGLLSGTNSFDGSETERNLDEDTRDDAA